MWRHWLVWVFHLHKGHGRLHHNKSGGNESPFYLVKVLVIHNAGTSKFPSGELKVMEDEVSGLRAMGVDTSVHVESNDDLGSRFSWRWVLAGVRVFGSLRSFRTTMQLLNHNHPDVVHFHSILPIVTPSALLACKLKGIPVVQTLHNFRWLCVEGGFFRDGTFCDDCIKKSTLSGIYHRCFRKSFLMSLLFSLVNWMYVKTGILFRLVDRFIAVSQYVQDKYVEAGFPRNQIRIKYNGVKIPSPTDDRGDSFTRKGVVYVGRLSPAKGTHILKEVIRQLGNQLPVTLVGNGPELNSLKSFSDQVGAGKVVFLGKVDQGRVFDVLSKAACLIVPSQCGESFPGVALEAMACGTPVVASKIGGLSEIVEASRGGVCVEPDKVEGYVAAIRAIVDSPALIQEMGAAGKDFVEKHCSLANSAFNLVQLYAELTGEDGPRPAGP